MAEELDFSLDDLVKKNRDSAPRRGRGRGRGRGVPRGRAAFSGGAAARREKVSVVLAGRRQETV